MALSGHRVWIPTRRRGPARQTEVRILLVSSLSRALRSMRNRSDEVDRPAPKVTDLWPVENVRDFKLLGVSVATRLPGADPPLRS